MPSEPESAQTKCIHSLSSLALCSPFSVSSPFSPSSLSSPKSLFLLGLSHDFPRPLSEVTGSPSSFGYDHFRAHFVEFQPQLSFMEKHLDAFHALQEGEKSHTD